MHSEHCTVAEIESGANECVHQGEQYITGQRVTHDANTTDRSDKMANWIKERIKQTEIMKIEYKYRFYILYI